MKTTRRKLLGGALASALALAFLTGCATEKAAVADLKQLKHDLSGLAGHVLIAGKPVAGSTVTLYAAGTGAPTRLADGKTDAKGAFKLDALQTDGRVLYLVAKGPRADVALLSLLGTARPPSVTVNELTTVASAYTAARFIEGEAISGKPLSLSIASGNTPNLVDPVTGGWGKVLLDPLNSSMTTTLATLDTLGSLITYSATLANDQWKARFYQAATPFGRTTPRNTLEAMAGIARAPWAAPKELYTLFDEAYPLPAPDGRRSAPFIPYLVWSPEDFCLSLCFWFLALCCGWTAG